MSTDVPARSSSPPEPDTQMQEENEDVDEVEDAEMMDAQAEEGDEERKPEINPQSSTPENLRPPREPRENRKDKDLNTFLNQMDKYAPIVRPSFPVCCWPSQIPDAVTEYYLSLAGFECSDQRMYTLTPCRR